MNKIKFADGTTYDTLSVTAKNCYVQGASRDALEIQFAKDIVKMDVLDALTADGAKTGKLTVITVDADGQEQQYIHDNYCIRAELALKPVIIAAATSTTPEQTEERLCVTLAQLTYAEVQAAKNAQDIADMQDAITAAEFGGDVK